MVRKNMSLKEQRIWKGIETSLRACSIIAIIIIAIIGGKFYLKFGAEKISIPEYDINIDINPSDILLNYNKDLPFTFKITNTGQKNFSKFKVSKIILRRDYIKEEYPLSVKDFRNNDIRLLDGLQVGESHTFQTEIFARPNFFDDKDKIPQFHVFIESNPPISPEIINLTII